MARQVSFIYEVIDRFTGPLRKVKRAQDRLNKSLSRGSQKAKKFSEKMGQVGGGPQAVAAVAGIGLMAKVTSDLEDKMSDVARVTDLSKTGVASLQSEFRGLSKATGKSATGFADIAFQAGKTGIASDKLKDFALNTIKTANAFDMVESEAGRALGSIRTKLDLSVDGVDVLMNRVNYLADTTVADGARMVNILERTSGTMKLFKIPTDVTAGWVAFADQVERSPELAASGINMMMNKLASMPGMTEKMLANPRTAIIDVMRKISRMDEVARIGFIREAFGPEAGRFVSKLVTKMDLLDKSMSNAMAPEALGSIDREWANYMARTSTKFKKFKQSVIDVFRTIGVQILRTFDKYYPAIQSATDKILSFVKAHPGLVKFGLAITAIGIVMVPLVMALGAFASGLSAVLAILPALGAVGTAIGVALGAITAPAIAVTAAVVGVGAAAYQAYKHFDVLKQAANDVYDSLAKVGKVMSQTSRGIWGGLKSAPGQILEGMFGGDNKNIVGQNAKANRQTIDGNINVTANPGTTVTKATLSSNHGNMGMNTIGAY